MTTLPALAIAAGAILVISPTAFAYASRRYGPCLVLGFLFLAQTAGRILISRGPPAASYSHTYLTGPLTILVFLLCIGALWELGPRARDQFIRLVLLGWCVSISVGIPMLVRDPGVIRTTMGEGSASAVAATTLAPMGIGEYTVYTSFAICLVPLFMSLKRFRPGTRWLAALLVCSGAVAVVLSTLTMASVLALLAVLAFLLSWALRGTKARAVVLVGVIVLILTASAPSIYTLAFRAPPTVLVTRKLTHMVVVGNREGITEGDETHRVRWFTQEMELFVKNPVLGYIPGISGWRPWGHSSFSNSLVLFGIFGAGAWFLALLSLHRVFRGRTQDRDGLVALQVGWAALAAAGILNPAWFSPGILVLLFVFTMPTGDTAASSVQTVSAE